MTEKSRVTKRLKAMGWTWRNGVSTKQDVGDGVSPRAFQIVKIDNEQRIHYLYSWAELATFIGGNDERN